MARVSAMTVYPRAYGGTLRREPIWSASSLTGLSPRVRGNRCASSICHTSRLGSIPARTGEPPAAATRHPSLDPRSIPARTGGPCRRPQPSTVQADRVYPRAYGGTSVLAGKRYPLPERRSIPARTGEPRASGASDSRTTSTVYPRAYGGTPPNHRPARGAGSHPGLSPRVRGNPAITEFRSA